MTERDIFEICETILTYNHVDEIPDDVVDGLTFTCEMIMRERNIEDMEHDLEFYGTEGS